MSEKSFMQNNLQWFVSLILFIVFAGFIIYNTWPQKHSELQELLKGLKQQTSAVKGTHVVKQETTTSKDVPVCDAWGRVITPSITTKEISSTTKTSDLPESYVITKEDMDKALTTVAYVARKEAQNEYKENFSILLTILTIFGIAWPVIIALLQFKFNESELKKIKKANKNADLANINAEDAIKKVKEAESKAISATQKAIDAEQKAIDAHVYIYRGLAEQFYFMGCDYKHRRDESDISSIPNFYFISAIEFTLRWFPLDTRNSCCAMLNRFIKELDYKRKDDACIYKLGFCKELSFNLVQREPSEKNREIDDTIRKIRDKFEGRP